MLGQFDNSFWMPTQASSYAPRVDWVFYFILAITSFFFLLITVVMIIFVIRYRRRPGHDSQPSAHQNMKLEVTWTIIPLIVVVVIFVVGFKGYMDMATPPANSYQIMVIAQRWSWAFQYPNGYVDANLHVPVDRPIELILTSRDVIHSFYVPAFRIKKDAVPGRYNKTWFQATQVNATQGFDLFCAEYCGTSHSAMLAKVFVHEPTEFARWLEDASQWEGRISPVERGRQLHSQRGCAQCHSLDGTVGIGPSFKDVWDRTVEGQTTFRDGSTLGSLIGPEYTPEQYIADSIFKPDEHYVAGFSPAMPSYLGQIKENDIPALIAFMKSLDPKYKAEAEAAATTQPAESPSAETQPATTPAANPTNPPAMPGTN
jgi:cytochrome c oxidase subunit 2